MKLFGFRRPHPAKEGELKSHEHWAQLKAQSDILNQEDRQYWRIYDNLYDLTNFDHPGGNDWIEMTRGNDITELFESYHPNIEKPKKLLTKYFHKKINEPRNSDSFTFDPKGFYATFRQRAWEILQIHGTGPTFQMLLIHDSLLLAFLVCLVITMYPHSDWLTWFLWSMVTGFILQCIGTCSHNFYHQKNNWRMYTWDITPASSYEWRISHGYSHHTFPNTAYDYEVMIFRPFLYFYPIHKSLLHRSFILIILQIVALVGMHLQGVQRYGRILLRKQKFRLEHLLPFAICVVMGLIVATWSGLTFQNIITPTNESILVMKQSLWLSFIRLNIIYFWSSWFFHNMSLGTGHHHPLIWHEGDTIPDKLDWGVFQVIAVVRCDEIDDNLFFASTTFGNHILHHLLPSVDHSKLPLVHDVFIQTCKEFKIDFNDEWFAKRKIKPFMGWVAMVQQLFRHTTVNTNFPSFLKKSS